jgi:hypothetical protein
VKRIEFDWGGVTLNSQWTTHSLFLEIAHVGNERIGNARMMCLPREEYIFTGMHVRPHIEHPLRFEDTIVLEISGKREIEMRAGLFVPESAIAHPIEFLRPLHAGGHEWFAVHTRARALVVLYGYHKREA